MLKRFALVALALAWLGCVPLSGNAAETMEPNNGQNGAPVAAHSVIHLENGRATLEFRSNTSSSQVAQADPSQTAAAPFKYRKSWSMIRAREQAKRDGQGESTDTFPGMYASFDINSLDND